MTLGADASTHDRLPYLPALDGLRGLALIAILLTHGGVERVRGGHLALTAFFTLSGFLITGLLLVERHRTGAVDLRRFWIRRARRLVPAMLLCFPLVAVVLLLADAPPTKGVVLDAFAAAAWVANWRFVVADQGYAGLFALPSPFQHFWSLAVEEQFYLAFPLVLVAVLGVGAQLRTRRLALLLGVLVVASTVQAARLHGQDGALGRAYYGTDARVAELLVGSLLALALVGPHGLRTLRPAVRRAVDITGVVGLALLAGLLLTLDISSAWTYRGGFLLAACCTAAVLASSVQAGSPVSRLLSLRPLVQLGLVSYGVYLFHWPLFLLITERSTGLSVVPLLLVRVGTTLALAWGSYVLLERPVRFGVLPARPALRGWAIGAVAGLVAVTGAVTVTTAIEPAGGGVGGSVALGGRARSTPAESTESGGQSSAVVGVDDAPAAGARPVPKNQLPGDEPFPSVPPRVPGALRVAVVGDSIAGDLGTGLSRWAAGRDDVQVVPFAIGGCPISRAERRVSADLPFPVEPECAWWARDDSSRWPVFEQFDPQVVLVAAGVDEIFSRRLDQWDGWRTPGDARVDRWLGEEYRSAVQRLRSGGASVLLVNAPCVDWQRWAPVRDYDGDAGDASIKAVNQAYSGVRGVEHVDLHGRICPGGSYLHDVEGVRGGRFDGFHFTDEAEDALARRWLGPLVLRAQRRALAVATVEGVDTPLRSLIKSGDPLVR